MPFRRFLRAASSIAFTWGVSWGILGTAMAFYTLLKFFLENDTLGKFGPVFILGQGVVAATVGTMAGYLFTLVFARNGSEKRSRKLVKILGSVAAVAFVPLFGGIRLLLGAPLELETLLWAAVWFIGLGADSSVAAIGLVRRGEVLGLSA
ncbi:MAG: hypothetical protein V4558_08745 [Gemmatimonadota bacterium]